MPKDNITELNGLIYVGAKQVFDKIGVHLKNPDRSTKPRYDIRLEGQIKN